jgi:hypothetical protein
VVIRAWTAGITGQTVTRCVNVSDRRNADLIFPFALASRSMWPALAE